MKIFLTGGTGFIGSNFIYKTLNAGHEVLALRRSLLSQPKIFLPKEPEWLNSSYENVKESQISDCDLLVHLASHNVLPPYGNLKNFFDNNIIKPLELFEIARKAGIKKYLVAGSCFEYGLTSLRYSFIPPDAPLEPLNNYAISKAAASISFINWALENKILLGINRIFHVYGNGENPSRFYPSLISAAESGNDFEMTSGYQIRDFISVNEVASKLLKECIEIYKSEKFYVYISNLGSGNPISLREFARKMWDKHSASGNLIFGAKKYRDYELMRCVPEISTYHILKKTSLSN